MAYPPWPLRSYSSSKFGSAKFVAGFHRVAAPLAHTWLTSRRRALGRLVLPAAKFGRYARHLGTIPRLSSF
jgi:hypothetical protein